MDAPDFQLYHMIDLPAELCDVALNTFTDLPIHDAELAYADGPAEDHAGRDSTLRFPPMSHWLSDIMYSHAVDANETCGWNFDIDGHESLQVAAYGPGQHFDWHIDTMLFSNRERDRKITCIVLLTDPAEFTGGNLNVMNPRRSLVNPSTDVGLVKGSMIAFPSFAMHGVEPVVSGLRQTATLWLSGARFR